MLWLATLLLQACQVLHRRFCCCLCSSQPLSHLAGFVLVIVGVPAADAIPALLVPVLRIRIRWIFMFVDLPDPNPDPLVRDMDPDPDPSIIKQKNKKNIDSYCYVTLYDFLTLEIDVNVPSKSNKKKNNFFVGVLKVTDENSRIRIH
jgi:hypothetical protein